ncbi:G-protein coupled receptor Mth2 isoform X2 [Culex quinquefasciatus]|uniref:G-protein coupled receptor Mth2 isoform X2 n=1 Tax=Culex quinquefasciatus TaxID=7176 RepID=UPI0018E33DAD|nr:G-protein coupled receptor Mth2 isoform X2 [Culex quinquefasciatus]
MRLKVITFLLQFLVVIVGTNGESILPCRFTESVNITSGEYNATDRTIFHDGVLFREENYATINYTVISYNKTDTDDYIRGCVCQVANCVWLCCYTFSDVDGHPRCDDSEYNEIEVPFEDENSETRMVNLTSLENIFVVIRYSEDYVFDAAPDEWLMNSTGYVLSLDGKTPIQQNDYCVESDGFLLFPLTPDPLDEVLQKTIGIIISIPFLLATLLIYACLPELRNIHGKSLICYVFSLTCAYLVILHLNMGWGFIPCKVVGYLFYFWVLVSFFWLNVMCFDIFWTFSSGVVIKNERRRFWYYSLYAWGSAFALTSMLLLIEKTDLLPEHLRPNIGISRCFINSEKMIEFVYFYLIILLIVVINVYFFIVTAVRIIRIQRATDAVLKQDSRRHSKFEKDRYRFSLYLRLFVVMGVTWTFELISWAVGENGYLFYVTDVCNCLLGVIIFFLFVWKKKVRQLALKRIGTPHALSRAKSTTLNTTSSTCTATASAAAAATTREGAIPLNRTTSSDSQA